jgi:regulator of sirC expression with transglutaminase-like and TPR domain
VTDSPRERFSALVRRADAEVNLGEGALLIACLEYPDLDVGRYLERLDRMAEAVAGRVAAAAGVSGAATALNEYLFEDEGFRGNDRHYYDPRNSFLNDVLDRRTGIPITLSTVYMEVARRLGLAVEGVGLPGHFIVRLGAGEEARLMDPFNGGAPLTESDCQQRLDRLYGGRLKLHERMLVRVDRKHVLARMLRNLKVIYMKASEHQRALDMVDLLLRLNPYSGEDLRDRGLLYSAIGCYEWAASDLETYLSLVPKAPEAEGLKLRISEMRHRAGRLN